MLLEYDGIKLDRPEDLPALPDAVEEPTVRLILLRGGADLVIEVDRGSASRGDSEAAVVRLDHLSSLRTVYI